MSSFAFVLNRQKDLLAFK